MKVIVEKANGITTISINRPEVRNAIDGDTAMQLKDAFADFEADSDARVAVLCGHGGHFCSGADLKSIAESSSKQLPLRVEKDGDGPLGPSRMLLSKPVIAAISGYAVAGGLELALWCDLRIMEQSATVGVFCRRWGVPLIDGGTVRLPRLIGLSRALDLILTGRPVSADEALNIGLANRLVADGQARAEAEKLAAEIARFPQQCLRHDRLSAYEQFGRSLPDALLNEFYHGSKTLASEESREGAKRFASGKGRHGDYQEL